MSNERLLKKIRRWSGSTREQPNTIDVEEYKRSVLSDITLLYNTQKGTVLMDEHLGVPDFTVMMNRFGDQEVTQIEKAFREVTDKYEPRIRNTAVRFAPRNDDHGMLRFTVSAVLSFKNQVLPFEFYALINGNGSVALEV
jgi:type VI secretion system lysozyme-like protein